MPRPELIKRRKLRKARQLKKAKFKAELKESLKKEFDALCMSWETDKIDKNMTSLIDFANQGKIQKELFNRKFRRKRQHAKSKKRNRNKLGSCLDYFEEITNTRPFQGGAPGLGKKH